MAGKWLPISKRNNARANKTFKEYDIRSPFSAGKGNTSIANTDTSDVGNITFTTRNLECLLTVKSTTTRENLSFVHSI